MDLRVAYTQAMREALALARQAAEAGDVPVGAVVLDTAGRIIGRGCNTREAHGDPLAHAEILAMREAAQTLAKAGSDTRDAAEAADMDDSDMDSCGVDAAKPYATHRQSDCMACRTVSDDGIAADEAAADGAVTERPRSEARRPHNEAHCARARSRSHFWNLADCTLVVTLEPCPMCAGAIVQARIPRVVIGCMNPKAGCAGSILDMLHEPRFNHQVETDVGVCGETCSGLLKQFFRELREREKARKSITESGHTL